jgi:nucleoside-diphosphate-sugar epimerase
MIRPNIVVTGASGFVGRHLVEALLDEYHVFGIARRSQVKCGVSPHQHLTWLQADIGEEDQIAEAFHAVAQLGGADTVIHLAAHYDFTGEESEEYWRTNVKGLRNVLDLCVRLHIRDFVFSSSVAACAFPGPGEAVTESSPPLGDHIYARTKRAGEEMLADYHQYFRTVVVRFAALFSDWCEYPPLYMFLQTWLTKGWNQRVLGGRGGSAIPFLHVHDLVVLMQQVLDRLGTFHQNEVLVASPDGCVSHKQLFDAATLAHFGERLAPRYMPKLLCGPGMFARDVLGRLTGTRPFEQPWMARYIDTELRIDASRTRARLDWAPRSRLAILRRIPFLIENRKTEPGEWHRKNREAMKAVSLPVNLRIHWLLQKHEEAIVEEFNALLMAPSGRERFAHYQDFTPEQHAWHHRMILQQLMNAVRTRERGIFIAYCRDLARQRISQGFEANELCGALEALNLVVFRVLRRDPASAGLRRDIYDFVTSTLKAGCDQAQEEFELHEVAQRRGGRATTPPAP